MLSGRIGPRPGRRYVVCCRSFARATEEGTDNEEWGALVSEFLGSGLLGLSLWGRCGIAHGVELG